MSPELIKLAACLSEANARLVALEKQTPASRVESVLRAEIQSCAKKLAALETKDASNEETRHAFARRADEIKSEFSTQLAAIHEEIKRKEYAAPTGFNPRGPWDSKSEYARNDLVSLNGSSYVATVDKPTEKPSKTSKQWVLVAARGSGGGGGFSGNESDYVSPPSSATAQGQIGQWSYDAEFYYRCVALNTWLRTSLATW